MMTQVGSECASGALLQLGSTIRALGTPDFPAALSRMAADDLLADQVVVFRVEGPNRIRTLLAQNVRDGAGHALSLADSYTKSYWSKDPNSLLLLPAADGQRNILLRTVRVEDIADPDYRRLLFVEPDFCVKAALLVRAPGCTIYMNFYRGKDRGPFALGELDAITQAGDMLAALVERHFAIIDDQAASSCDAVQRVVAEAAGERGTRLSAREAAVCARIVAAHSVEGIAFEFGVSQHSVVSYRRRAFAKLGIATHKELFSLVLRRHWRLGV